MKSKIISAALAATLALSMTACGDVSETTDNANAVGEITDSQKTESVSQDVSSTEDESLKPIEEISENFNDDISLNPGFAVTYYLDDEEKIAMLKDSAKGINGLNVAMLNTVASASDSKGEMLSGFSAYSCIAAAAKYTEGSTKDQIENALGVMTPDALTYFKDNMPIDTGTMFLVDDSTKLNAENIDDFVFKDLQSAEIVGTVNDYVAYKTHNLITSLISNPFNDDTRAVVLDTLYFKGTWQHKFDKDATNKQVFHGTNGDTETDFMNTRHKYAVNTEDKVIELAYESSSLVMDICYDIGNKTPDTAFESYVSKSDQREFTYDYEVNLSIPKFETESYTSLADTCKSLGMTNMFDPAFSGDFKSLADDVYVSDIIQKTKIIVDEEGTEAAAVTMMTMDTACVMPDEPKILDITIDKPFVYAIRDTTTNIILFAGYVNGF